MSRPISKNASRGQVVSARVSQVLRDELYKKFPNDGDISKLIRVLLQKYMDGRILGIKLTE
jgi:hypothetical protein